MHTKDETRRDVPFAPKTTAENVRMEGGNALPEELAKKLDKASVVNNLTTTAANYALDARMGKYIVDNISNPNLLINGDFQVWQRGTNFSGWGYSADRWFISSAAQLWKDGNMAVFQFLSGQWNFVAQYVERPSRLAGKTLTVSVSVQWTYMPVYLVVDIFDAGNNRTILASQNFGVVNGILSLTFTVPSDITDNHLMIVRLFQDGGQTNVIMALNYIKLEIGNIATPFAPRPYGQELALCKRYYQIIGSDDIATNPRVTLANAKQGSLLYMSSFGFTPMRVDPTPTYFGTHYAVIQSIDYIPLGALYAVSTRNGIFTATINSAYADIISWHGKVAMVYKIGLDAEIYQ